MADDSEDRPPSAPFDADARILLFGYDDTPARLRLRARSRSWRVGGAVRVMLAAVIVAPLVGLVPPHAPWIIGALVGGGILARRRWTEHFTVLEIEGACPRCGGTVDAPSGRLKRPHPVVCTACHHEASAAVATDSLRGAV